MAIDWTAEDEDTAAWVAAESARIAAADRAHAAEEAAPEPRSAPGRLPDFAADARDVADYHEALKAFVAAAVARGIATARDAHLARRAEHESAIALCEGIVCETTIAAVDAAARYAKFGQRRRRTNKKSKGPQRPSLMLNVRTLWAAQRAYRKVLAAQSASNAAYDAVRAAQAALDRHDRRFENTVAARELELRRFYNSTEGKSALVNEPALAVLAQRVAAIRQERTNYQARFAADEVSAEEQRAREMAAEGYRFLNGPIAGAFFLGQVAFGAYRYHIVRDGDGRDWLIDWNDALRPIERLLVDLVRTADGSFLVRRSTSADRRTAGGEVLPHADGPAAAERGVRPAILRAFADFAEGFH